jgi:membrane-associated phospholipid phosphatase
MCGSAILAALPWFRRSFDFARRNSYIVMLAAYVAVLLVAYFRFGVLFQFTLGVYAILALPLIFLASRQRLLFIKSWTPFIVVILLYEALQSVISVAVAKDGVMSLYPIDYLVWGFNLTGAVQRALLSPVLTAIMIFFYSLDPLLVVLVSIYFWHSDKAIYKRYVYAVAITSYSALVTFLLFPTAPPWYEGVASNLLQGAGTMAKFYMSFTNLVDINKFAAFPSLHAAYAIAFLYYMQKRGKRYGLVALPITAGILLSTIYLGQHYLIDLIGGTAYCLTACFLVDWFSKRFVARGANVKTTLPSVGPTIAAANNPAPRGTSPRRLLWSGLKKRAEGRRAPGVQSGPEGAQCSN